ncbi:MAG: hypothetical protein IKD45_04495 [Clostridia bacterium]|nr:hypothetical protein [Clostridia bacterium]
MSINGKWTKKWKATLIFLCSYLNFLAYALVGGYVIVKDEDEDLKKVAKEAFILTLVFTALSAFLSIYSYIGGFFDNYYSSVAYDIYGIISPLIAIAKIATYATLVVHELLKKDDASEATAAPEANGATEGTSEDTEAEDTEANDGESDEDNTSRILY